MTQKNSFGAVAVDRGCFAIAMLSECDTWGLAPPLSDVLHDYYYYSYCTIIAVCKAVDVYWIYLLDFGL